MLVPVAWWVLYRSRWGLLVRGVGERDEVLSTYGHPARRVQYLAVIVGGMLAGVGGAQLSTAYANAWFENMTQGRGFIACAVVIFAARQPFKVAAGAYLFGAALALSPALQARGYAINQFALASIPYLVIIAVLVLLGKKRAAEAPEGLKKVFEISPGELTRSGATDVRRTRPDPQPHATSPKGHQRDRTTNPAPSARCRRRHRSRPRGGGVRQQLQRPTRRPRRPPLPAGPTTAAGATAATGTGPGVGSKAVGFIFVGPKDDFGYNQAAYEGSEAVKKAFPDLDILTAENVPETDEAARVMESMISKGAKIIFATSYGHLDAALKVAADHPDVAVVQQGNIITGAIPPNVGTYFGTVYEPVYLAGIVAGKETKTNKLGYVYAFPIPQTVANINAFELGAKSVNPDAKTYVVNTSSWCDPAKQADAAKSLLGQGVDVLTQHQDCTGHRRQGGRGRRRHGRRLPRRRRRASPRRAGSPVREWEWGDLYTDIVKTALAGTFTGSKYNANFRVGFKDGDNPFVGVQVRRPGAGRCDQARGRHQDRARPPTSRCSPARSWARTAQHR